MAAAAPDSRAINSSCAERMKLLTPPSNCRTAARAARPPSAEIRAITASALLRSIRPFRNARRVNSPGSASRAPRRYRAFSTLMAAQAPPCRWISATSSRV